MFAILSPETECAPPPSWETLAEKARYRPEALAAMCGVSLRTLQRHFRADYDLALCEWLKAVRLEVALKALSHGRSIKEVAIDLGYTELSNFSRAFKERFGIPPREAKGLTGMARTGWSVTNGTRR